MAVAIMSKLIRLDKYLVDMNKGSRSQIKEAAKKGRILVNGTVEKKTERKIDPDLDTVTMDGMDVNYNQLEYYMLSKPAGVITATEDRRQKTVIDLMGDEVRRDLFPVGRLDIDTEGLLLITNDGDLAHQLLSPKKHVDKQYYAKISGKLPDDAVQRFAAGITLEDGTETKPAELQIHDETKDETGDSAEVYLTIQEGKFHQVKRMFEALGCHVEYLKRMSMGPLVLDPELAPGEYRPLTSHELELLKKSPDYSKGIDAELRKKKAVIFDLDGTLADSMWMWHDIDIEYLEKHGHVCPPMLQRTIEGMSFSETAVYFKEQFQIPESLDEIKQTWIDMSLAKYRDEVPLKKGVRQFLEYLKEHNIRMGIASSNSIDMILAVLDSQKIRGYFDAITTGCEVEHGKPAPDVYLKTAEKIGVQPEDCMVFEDIPAGIRAGVAAGMKTCAVEDEHSAWIRAEKISLADYYVRDYDEILELLK
jgi:16S rRNA pseudouridine516 synthase